MAPSVVMLFLALSPLSNGGADLREPWGAALLWEMWESAFSAVAVLIFLIVQLILAKPSKSTPGSIVLAWRMALLHLVAQASLRAHAAEHAQGRAESRL